MSDINKLAEILVNLKIIEVNDLVKILKEKYGITPTYLPIASQFKPETLNNSKIKTTFDVILKSSGSASTKITVVKRIKDLIGLGLKESKDLVDNVPKELKKGLSKDEAELLKKKLEEVGAEIELK